MELLIALGIVAVIACVFIIVFVIADRCGWNPIVAYLITTVVLSALLTILAMSSQ